MHLNCDNICNILDLMTVALGFGQSLGDPRYNSNYDFDDTIINLLDDSSTTLRSNIDP